jgi:hypothetical protein
LVAPGLRVTPGGLRLPGGAPAEPVWQALADRRPTQPADFVRALVGSSQGRLAPFFGAMAQMTPAQIRVAFNLDSPDVSTRVESARRLYSVSQRLMTGRMAEQRAFSRPALDPVLLISGLGVDDDGQPLVPGTKGFWNLLFDEEDNGRPKITRDEPRLVLERSEPVDFSWLSEQVFKGSENSQRRHYAMVLFAARRLDRLTPETARDAIDAVRGASMYPALMTAVERAKVVDLKAFASAARRATELSAIGDDGHALRAFAQFQGAVALVTRAGSRGSLTPKAVSELVVSLSAVPVSSQGEYDGGMVRWLDRWADGAVATIRPGAATPSPGSLEEIIEGVGAREKSVLRLLAGPVASDSRVISWEGTRYHLDLARAEAIRLIKMLGENPRPYLSWADSLVEAADSFSAAGLTREQLRQRVQTLERIAHAEPGDGGVDSPPLPDRYREVMATLQRAASGGDVRAAAHAAPSLRALSDDLLARGLTEMVYAMSLGERDGLSIAASEAAPRHDFGAHSIARSTAWRAPQAGADVAQRWRVTGSLLGLDVALADFSLVRLSNKPPPRKPSLGDADRRTFVDALALVEPSSLADADGDRIVAALAKGRARLDAVHTPADAVAVAEAAGLSALRQTLLPWVLLHDPERLRVFLSPSELLWLGLENTRIDALNAWGAPAGARLACLCLQIVERRPWEAFAGRLNSGMMASAFPDLNLRIAELLAGLQMPAALLGPVLTSATLDFVATVISRDPDDRRGLVEFVQGIDADRVELYLALLTTDGPLVPIGEAPGKEAGASR